MLKELQLTNFKSFAGEPQTIPFAPVTIFVGANASGKSNVFDAIRFLQGIGSNLSIHDIFRGVWSSEGKIRQGIRGGAAEACWGANDFFSIVSQIRYKSLNLKHTIRICTERVSIEGESLDSLDGKNWFASGSERVSQSEHSKPGFLTVDFETDDDPHRSSEDISDAHSSLSRLPSPSETSKLFVNRYSVVSAYDDFRFLDVKPSLMRDYVPAHVSELGSHGENMSAILYQLSQDDRIREQLLEWLNALCTPDVTDFQFEITAMRDAMLSLVESDPESNVVSARSLSDGTLRFMGLLATLFSVPKGSVLLFEEIENGLHPTRLHLLIELFEQFAEARNIQIIATTHSSQALLALSEEALRSTVLFARNEEHPGTIVRRLGDLPHFDEVTQKTKIDELFTTGWLEFAV